jgi:dTDP-4-dehydrorhamnose reductase
MRAPVIGGSGQLGGWLPLHPADRGHVALGLFGDHPDPGTVRLDAADLRAAPKLPAEHRPGVVFDPAGFTRVDRCERDPARSDAADRSPDRESEPTIGFPGYLQDALRARLTPSRRRRILR